jgi:hypothetical protein
MREARKIYISTIRGEKKFLDSEIKLCVESVQGHRVMVRAKYERPGPLRRRMALGDMRHNIFVSWSAGAR